MTRPLFKIQPTNQFKKELKSLSKKYPSVLEDIEALAEELMVNPLIGTSLGNGFYKIRLAISSKAQGKSGGARVITNVRILNNIVYLINIYDKSEKESISLSQLKAILKTILPV